jgi:hypothetical protein
MQKRYRLSHRARLLGAGLVGVDVKEQKRDETKNKVKSYHEKGKESR